MSRGRPYTDEEDEVILAEIETRTVLERLAASGITDRSPTSIRARRQYLRRGERTGDPVRLQELLNARKKLQQQQQRLDNELNAEARAVLEQYLSGVPEDEKVKLLQEFLNSDGQSVDIGKRGDDAE